MNQEELKRLIAEGESETVEFKESFDKNAAKAAAAFANTKGGVIIFGLSDNGDVKGVTVGKDTLKDWGNQISQRTDPSIVPTVDACELGGTMVVIISIKPSSTPVAMKGRFYTRAGATTRVLAWQEVKARYEAGGECKSALSVYRTLLREVLPFVGLTLAIIAFLITIGLHLNIIPTGLLIASFVGVPVFIFTVFALTAAVVSWEYKRKKLTGLTIVLVVVVVLAGVFLTVRWDAEMQAPPQPMRPYSAPGITITNPANGDSINGVNVTVRGTSQINVTNQSIWVLVYPQNAASRFYPQQSVKEEGDGRWECNVHLGTNNTSTLGKYDIYAVLVDKASTTTFQNYLANSNEQQSWPGLSSQPGVITADHITLTRVQ